MSIPSPRTAPSSSHSAQDIGLLLLPLKIWDNWLQYSTGVLGGGHLKTGQGELDSEGRYTVCLCDSIDSEVRTRMLIKQSGPLHANSQLSFDLCPIPHFQLGDCDAGSHLGLLSWGSKRIMT